MSTFATESTFTRVAPGRHRGTLGEGWTQGRGALGGLVAAILARALDADAPEGLHLTTLTTAFLAPATAGAAEVVTERLRTGRNVATARASLVRGEQLLATALGTLTRPREGALVYEDRPARIVPPPETVADGPDPHYYPAFTRRLSFRQCLGPAPFSGGTEAHLGGWCRLEEPEAPVDRALVTMLLDAWPPAATALAPTWCPVASIELTCQFLVELPDPEVVPGSWLFFEARARHVGGGLADETATLSSPSGRPLATARQLIALFPPDGRGRPTARYGA